MILEGQEYRYDLLATDIDNDPLIFSIDNAPSGMRIEDNVLLWTPGYDQEGIYTDIAITVSDNQEQQGIDSKLFTITVGNQNRPPTINNIFVPEVEEEIELSFTVNATDPDGDIIIISISNEPVGSTFNNSTFTWTPDYLQAGLYNVVFTATDTHGDSTSFTAVITVGETTNQCGLSDYIVDQIQGLPLENNNKNAYSANMKKVCIFVSSGKFIPARNQVEAYLQKVQQDLELSKIDGDSAFILNALGNEMLDLLLTE